MRQCLLSAAILVMFLLITTIAQAGTYSPDFDSYLAQSQSDDKITAIITMTDRVDLEVLKEELYNRKADRQEWHETVITALQDKATKTQIDVNVKLDKLAKQGLVSSYKNMWLGNMIIVTATKDAFDQLVARNDIELISPDYKVKNQKSILDDTPLIENVGSTSGIRAIRADEVWQMGYTGAGRLACNIDTGVEGDHEALEHNWRGLDSRYADHPEWAWNDPLTSTDFPFTNEMHGTHTMGTICGMDEVGDTIGVAYGAEWIASGCINRVGSLDGTISLVLVALEWVVDPDEDPATVWDVPDVCNNSWGFATVGDEGNDDYICHDVFWESLEAAEASGVVIIFAAGNEGEYGSESITNPADLAITELSVFSVGAVNGDNPSYPIADWSSRGPSYCTSDGSAAIKPEIVAPGVSIRSCDIGGGFGYSSGTSMAAPHVAAVVVLMREANPDLTSDQIKQILLETADDLGSSGEDNNYGRGMLDAYEAVYQALSYRDEWGIMTGTITDETTGYPIANANVIVAGKNWHTTTNDLGEYYLYMPSDTTYDIIVELYPEYTAVYSQQSVTENDTTTVNYALVPAVTATFTVSFDNQYNDYSYKPFYIGGSWNNYGVYDDTWSSDLTPIYDDGVDPDDVAGDGVYSAEIPLAKDTEYSYSWNVYTENYGVNGIEDALLASGSDFNIYSYDPVTVPELAPNPSGSSNEFVFSFVSDQEQSFELSANYNDIAYMWGAQITLTGGITYNFKFDVMNDYQVSYGSGGVGGDPISYTASADGVYEITFNDNNDSYMIDYSGSDGIPLNFGTASGYDGHVPVAWIEPGSAESAILSYDSGTTSSVYAYSLYEYANLTATMFTPESYPVIIDSVMVQIWNWTSNSWPDGSYDPVGISIFLEGESGLPADEPVFHTTVTTDDAADSDWWLKIDVNGIAVVEGSFWVAMNNVSGHGYEAIAVDDDGTDYPANQFTRQDNEWIASSLTTGDHMIRARVFSDDVASWLGYNKPTPADEIDVPVMFWDNPDLFEHIGFMPDYNSHPSQNDSQDLMTYHPQYKSVLPVITETEEVFGYNLYRGTTANPFDRGQKINSSLLTDTYYDDWGSDIYGPLANDTTYFYQFSAVYDVNGSNVEVGPSTSFTGTPLNQPPALPTNFTGSVENRTINLSWDANTDYDIAGYTIYRKLYGMDNYELIATVEHPTTIFTEEMSIDGLHRYRLKAIDEEEMESSNSQNVALLIGNVPPGGVGTSTDDEFLINVEWSAPGYDYSSLITDAMEINNVVVLHTEYFSTDEIEDAMDYVVENTEIESYDLLNFRTAPITLNSIEDYDMVIIYTYMLSNYRDSTGNVLADYIELGKPVIMMNYCYLTTNPMMTGRFMEDYSLFTRGAPTAASTLGEYDESSPIMADISELGVKYTAACELQNNGVAVAYWENGHPLAAYSTDHPIVCLNAYTGYNNRSTGDIYQLLANSVSFLANYSDPPIENHSGYNLYKSESENGAYDLLATFDTETTSYVDTVELNGVPYYYKVTALYGELESEGVIAEGMGQNHAPEAPTSLAYTVSNYTASLNWEFTNIKGDLDHFNIYRRLHDESEWSLIATSVNESYADVIENENGIFDYRVTAVDNGDPALESESSNNVYIAIGRIPPGDLFAVSNYDGMIPLKWYEPGIRPCTTFVYDNGVCFTGAAFVDYNDLFAKKFTGELPFEICSLYVHVLTEGDTNWPWPDGHHDPCLIQIWEDGGDGMPGEVLAETTVTCELGEWITIAYPEGLACNTESFWVSWANINDGNSFIDGIGVCEGSWDEHDWYRTDGQWYQGYPGYIRPTMIRASITNDSSVELPVDNNPDSIGTISLAKSNSEFNTPQLCDTEEILGYYIYRSSSPDVPIDDDHRITSSYVTDLYYDDENVINDSTYYYIAVAVYDIDGATLLSPASNEVSATPHAPGQLTVNCASIDTSGSVDGSIVIKRLTLTNSGGQPVTFNTFASTSDYPLNTFGDPSYLRTPFNYPETVNCESEADNDNALPVVTDHGGSSHSSVYRWIDSHEAYGPVYNWVDISEIGEYLWLGERQISEQIEFGFDFPFFDSIYSSIYACTNGWISFTANNSGDIENWDGNSHGDLPNGYAPFNVIGLMWQDNEAAELYYYSSQDSFIVTYDKAQYSDNDNWCKYQLILTSDGIITIQYNSLDNGDTGYYTCDALVGLQNSTGLKGLTVVNNNAYLRNEMAIRLESCWLSTNRSTSSIPAGESIELAVYFDPENLSTVGVYNGNLYISASDVNHNLDYIDIPVTFEVSDSIVGVIDGEGTLPKYFAVDQNYPNPFNAQTEINYLLPIDSYVTFEIYNVLGQKVVTLLGEHQKAGRHTLIWNGTNENGNVVTSGIYYYKLATEKEKALNKMILLK